MAKMPKTVQFYEDEVELEDFTARMASRLMSRQARVVAYLPNLRAAVRHFRAFSSHDERHSADMTVDIDSEPTLNDTHRKWPDSQLGPLNPHDARFPMPGLVGMNAATHNGNVPQVLLLSGPRLSRATNELLVAELATDRHAAVLQQCMNTVDSGQILPLDDSADGVSSLDTLECVAETCPELVKRDFQELFPARDLRADTLTVITLSQRTRNDMTGWSQDVEEERDALIDHFVAGAQDICIALTEAGYWADFIDPTSGRPYLGAYTNATLYETDERYRHLGFEIEDLGCCKVIRHHLWGSHSYVGCIFTNAPVDHPIIQQMKPASKDGD